MMKRFFVPLLTMAVLVGLAGWARASGSFEDGHRLAVFLDSLDVEHRWPAGVHVNWETGLPDGRVEKFEGKHTHCSAFVASAAKQLGVYILRPPEHNQVLLANAQYEWLRDQGTQYGWEPVPDGYEAQRKANRGFLVVATYMSHNPEKPGHIAIVRPSGKSRDQLLSEGPEVIQAGETNYRSVSLQVGFSGHPAAWGKQEVRYYAHDLP